MPKIKPRTRVYEKNKTATSKNAFYCFKRSKLLPLLFSLAVFVDINK